MVVLGQYKAVLVGFCWYRLLLEDLYFDDLCFYGNGLIVGGFNGFYGKMLIVGGFNGFYGKILIVGGFNCFCGKILIVGGFNCRLSICDYWLSWTNTVLEAKIQATLLILRRGALSRTEWLSIEQNG